MAEVEWSTSDPEVARVANTGTVFIEGEGEAVITASWKDQTAECLVQVEAAGTEENTDLEAQPGIWSMCFPKPQSWARRETRTCRRASRGGLQRVYPLPRRMNPVRLDKTGQKKSGP